MVIRMENIEELFQGINMATLAIDHLIDKIENQQLKDLVLHQRKAYLDLKTKLEHLYSFQTDEVKNKLYVETMIEMKTMLTNDKKIAKMLSEGTHQAILKSTHLLNNQEITDTSLRNHYKEFEVISQNYITKLKQFL